MKQLNIKQIALKTAKLLLFAVLFLVIYSYSREVLRNKSESEALGVIMKQPNDTYDVILCGPSHMQYAVQPALLFGEFGIASCNTSTAAQSIPTTYYVIKEMVERHDPELVVLDLFCLFYPENFFAPARFHQAIDNFNLSPTKVEAVLDLADESQSEYLINYLLYHTRWKELTRDDYKVHDEYHEKYQHHMIRYAYPEPFTPVYDKADVPDVPLEYLKKIVDYCKETDTELLLTVIPYRADIDNNDTSAILQQQMYNTVEELAKQWDVEYFNALHHLDEMSFDFSTDMIEWSHINAYGAEKVTRYYGKMIKDNYDIPDRSQDEKYLEWHEDYKEYLATFEDAEQPAV